MNPNFVEASRNPVEERCDGDRPDRLEHLSSQYEETFLILFEHALPFFEFTISIFDVC
jgi:hypothetical protein